jgi:hypothetical protein
MTDSDLDRLLEAVNDDLLAHIAATSDSAVILTGLMARDTSRSLADDSAALSGAGHDASSPSAALAIGMRSNGRRLTDRLDRAIIYTVNVRRALAGAHELTRYLTENTARAFESDFGLTRPCTVNLDLAGDVTYGIARGADRALDFARVVDRALDQALELDHDLALTLACHGFEFIYERFAGPAYVRGCARDLYRARELSRDLAQIRDNARDCARSRRVDLDVASALDRFVQRATDLVDELADKLTLRLDDAHARDRALAMQKVDASGTDLSRADIHDLEVLDGVIWTPQTAWPPGMAHEVRSRSREIRPGVYQVGEGNDPERALISA